MWGRLKKVQRCIVNQSMITNISPHICIAEQLVNGSYLLMSFTNWSASAGRTISLCGINSKAFLDAHTTWIAFSSNGNPFGSDHTNLMAIQKKVISTLCSIPIFVFWNQSLDIILDQTGHFLKGFSLHATKCAQWHVRRRPENCQFKLCELIN